MKLIVNADDLGISLSVNAAITKGIISGCVSSSTIMANAPAFSDAVRIAKQYPQVSYGVHLNLIEFMPLTNAEIFKKYGLVGKDSNFIEGAVFTISNFTDELKDSIYQEWDAQINKVIAAGIIPTHLDSHQHVHAIYELREVLCNLLDKYSIRSVRRAIVPSVYMMLHPRKGNAVRLEKSNAMRLKSNNVLFRRFILLKTILRTTLWNKYMRSKYVVTDDFLAYRTLYWYFDLLGEKLKTKIIELMVHPGHPAFEEETKLLMSNAIDERTDSLIITYKDL